MTWKKGTRQQYLVCQGNQKIIYLSYYYFSQHCTKVSLCARVCVMNIDVSRLGKGISRQDVAVSLCRLVHTGSFLS